LVSDTPPSTSELRFASIDDIEGIRDLICECALPMQDTLERLASRGLPLAQGAG
jgi:hypothetical protein